jgi:TusA-related sulfurtransferase
MTKTTPPEPATDTIAAPPAENIVADQTIDITRDICPMTFVRTRLALDRLQPGQVLCVRLRGDEPLRNVPRTAQAQGHTLLGLAREAEGVSTLWLRRG